MIVVCDTSPITNLIQINQLDLLKELYEFIIIPSAVYNELSELENQKLILKQTSWIRTIGLSNKSLLNDLLAELDEGESESIALAIELNADYVLIDEQKGRNIAEQYGLRVVGLLGVLLAAKAKGLVAVVKPLMDQLIREAGFKIRPLLYQRILEIAGENIY